jgi:hypothetical protein
MHWSLAIPDTVLRERWQTHRHASEIFPAQPVLSPKASGIFGSGTTTTQCDE